MAALTKTSALRVEIAGPKMPNNTSPRTGAKRTAANSHTVEGRFRASPTFISPDRT